MKTGGFLFVFFLLYSWTPYSVSANPPDKLEAAEKTVAVLLHSDGTVFMAAEKVALPRLTNRLKEISSGKQRVKLVMPPHRQT